MGLDSWSGKLVCLQLERHNAVVNSRMNWVPHPGPLDTTKSRDPAPKKTRKEKKEEKAQVAFPLMYVHPRRKTAEETGVLGQN